jgi:hypothetical protein
MYNKKAEKVKSDVWRLDGVIIKSVVTNMKNRNNATHLVISSRTRSGRKFFLPHILVLYKKKVVPVLPLPEHHAMKAYWGSGGTAPPIL